jgi:hypothetical protein
LAVAISFGAPSHFAAWTCPASSGAAAARMLFRWARTLPPAAGAVKPRSVIIMVTR